MLVCSNEARTLVYDKHTPNCQKNKFWNFLIFKTYWSFVITLSVPSACFSLNDNAFVPSFSLNLGRLDSCIIAGNRLTGEMKASEKQILGGGVYCAGTLELSGTTSITGNRAQDAQNNLWLDETAALKIGSLGLDKPVSYTHLTLPTKA